MQCRVACPLPMYITRQIIGHAMPARQRLLCIEKESQVMNGQELPHFGLQPDSELSFCETYAAGHRMSLVKRKKLADSAENRYWLQGPIGQIEQKGIGH